MINYLESLLTELGYLKNEYNFFHKEGDDFFRVNEYTENDILNYFKTDVTGLAVTDFEKLINYDDTAKVNTAQIIIVKVQDLKNYFSNYKNQLMKIEEDPYYFRKYVVVYTEEAMRAVSQLTLPELNEFILAEENYNLFEEDMYSYSAYFVAMECYIKLPFLALPIMNEKYSSLEQLIETAIVDKKQNQAEMNVTKITEFAISKVSVEDFNQQKCLTDIETDSELINLLKELY